MVNRSFLLLLAGLCWAECIEVKEIKYGTIELIAFDATDAIIAPVNVELLETGTRKVLQKTSRGKFERVRYGAYTIRVWAPGFRSSTVPIHLDQSELSVRAQLAVGMECGGYSSASGSVSPPPENRELWVKLVPIKGVGGIEARVGPHGFFLASGLESGKYLLLVLEGSSVLRKRPK